MSLDNLGQVDAVGIDRQSGEVVLTITDYWDWTNEQPHLHALQRKLDAYFHFIESGQMYSSCPEACGREVMIDVVGKYALPPSGERLLAEASTVAARIRVRIGSRHVPDSQEA